MKIIQVHNYYQQAGGEDAVVAAERALLETNGNTVVPYYKDNKGLGSGLWALGKASLQTIWNGETYREFRKLLKREKPDVVHCHNTFPLISPSIYWACAKEKVLVVQTLHNFRLACATPFFYRDGNICEQCIGKSFPYPALKYRCYRKSLAGSLVWALMVWLHRLAGTYTKKVDRYIALTDFACKKLIECGLPGHKLIVKPNFLHHPPISDGPPDVDGVSSEIRSLTSGQQSFALFVGRLSPEKGCGVLLKAWEKFSQAWRKEGSSDSHSLSSGALSDFNTPIPRLLIVGDGPEREPLEKTVSRASDGIQQSLLFLGRRSIEEVLYLMHHAQFLVLPSLWYEGFPMTILEAFYQSLPVVASDLGSMPSVIEHKRTGLLFSPGDVEDLTKSIHWAFSHLKEMQQMGQAARIEFELKYTAEANYEQLIRAYQL